MISATKDDNLDSIIEEINPSFYILFYKTSKYIPVINILLHINESTLY
jgi:hypothetical protein